MGWFWTVALFGTIGLASEGLARYGARQSPGWPRILSAIVIGWSWLTVGVEALGSFGWLARGPLLGWAALGLLAAGACRWRRGPSDEDGRSGGLSPPESWGWEGVMAVGLVLWAAATIGAIGLYHPVKVVSDGPIYHLYFAARWWKSGRLDLIAAPFGENGATYFPASGDLWFTTLMIAWGGDLLAKIGQAPFLLVSALTTYALARRLGAGRSSSAVATSWFATCSVLMIYSFEPNVDTLFVAGYLLSAYFLVRHALGDDGPIALGLAGLAAGCALGTKATGVVLVPPLLALGVASAIVRGKGMRARGVGVATALLSPLLVAGFWYGRNAILTGNPLYPLHLSAFGMVWLRGWYGPETMRLSPYHIPVSDLAAFGDTLLAVLDPRLVPFWFGALAGAWAVGRRSDAACDERPRLDRLVWACAGLAVVNVAIYWLVVPYRTQQRFMIQALGLAAVPLARTFDSGRWVRVAGAVLLLAHLVTPQGWPIARPGSEPPWDLSPNVPNAIPSLIALGVDPLRLLTLDVTTQGLLAMVGALLIGSAAMVCAFLGARALARPTRRDRAWAVVGALGLFLVTSALVFPWGFDDRRRFFPNFPDYLRGWLALDVRAGPVGGRVAYAGTDLPYYLMGVGLRNEVRYVNIDARRDWLLHDYQREAIRTGSAPATWPHPRPGWDRIQPEYSAWLENLRAEGIQWLVVTRANPDEGPHNLATPDGYPIERVWADAHPEVFARVYGVADGDPLFQLYRVRPPAAVPAR